MSTKSEINISTIWDIFKVLIVPEAPGGNLISNLGGERMKRGEILSHVSGGGRGGDKKGATDFLIYF